MSNVKATPQWHAAEKRYVLRYLKLFEDKFGSNPTCKENRQTIMRELEGAEVWGEEFHVVESSFMLDMF